MDADARADMQSRAKRRRSLVAMACDRCPLEITGRKLKQGCDGQRPACSQCIRRNAMCEYERDTRGGESRQAALRRELEDSKLRLDEVADAMEFLRQIPYDRAEEVLGLIKMADDPIEALSSLHENMQHNNALSNYETSRAIAPPMGSRLAYELSVSHPSAYPILIPIEQNVIFADRFSEYSQMRSGRYPMTTAPLNFDTGSGQLTVVPSTGQLPNPLSHSSPADLIDRRLHFLNIRQWTEVVISDKLAATVLSLYLETDHPVLGWFDADLFVTTLCGGLKDFCSHFLVSSLFYWICKAYNAFDPESDSLSEQFLEEAKSRWQGLQDEEDSTLTVAACMILSLGLAYDGNDKLAELFKSEGIARGERLRLFNVSKSSEEIALEESMPANAYRSRAHIAWGAFNWICLHSLHYDDLVVDPPSFHIPVHDIPYMGHSFSAICKFRRIFAEVVSVYNAKADGSLIDRVPLSFAERKYQELLDWADSLDGAQRRYGETPHHVMVFHIWYHAAILDVFRPFVSRGLLLQSFTAVGGAPETICDASLSQLKCLAVEYRYRQPSALYSIFWHTSMLYIGNAVFRSSKYHADWRFYLDLCVNAYLSLFTCYRISASFLQGLVLIAVENGLLDKTGGDDILSKLSRKGNQLHAPLPATSSHIVDFEQAFADQSSAHSESYSMSD